MKNFIKNFLQRIAPTAGGSARALMVIWFMTFFCATAMAVVPPAITSISPSVGYPLSSVTITGTNFNTTAANNIVYFGATKATVNTASATSLSVTVPVGATYQPVSVLNTSSALTGYSQYPFLPTYDNSAYVPGAINCNGKVDFTTGTTPYSVAIGDLDGDGKADLAVVNYFSNTVSVFRNTSSSGSITSGSFAASVNFSTGTNPQSVAIGDLDGDGKADLAVANSSSTSVSVFRNTSSSGSITSSSFATKVDFTTGPQPYSVAIGDLDGDGKADLVVASYGSNSISVLRNVSSSGSITNTSFAVKVNFTTGTEPYSVAIGDLDGNGKADLAVVNSGSSTVSVFRNTSSSGSITSGSFAAKVDFTTGINPISVAIGDLDGDGKADLAVTNNSDNTVSVIRNTSSSGSITSSSFAAKVDFATGTYPEGVAIGDLDGDGKADLAATNYASAKVSLLRNTSSSGSITSGSFAAKVDFATGSHPVSVAIGDLDGDGKADLAVANASSTTVSVIRNSPSLLPLPTITSLSPSVGYPLSSVTIAGTNFNTTAANNVVYFGATKATVNTASATSLNVTVPVGATYQPVSVLNTSSALTGYSQYPFLPTYDNSAYVPGVINYDWKVDFTTGTNPFSVAIGDLDGDGKADLAVANYGSATVSVFRNTSASGSITSGSFAPKVDFATGTNPYGVAIGDMDGDGKADLAVANYGSNTVSVLRNTGSSGSVTTGSFAAKVDFATGTMPIRVAIGDLDGDGKADLAVVNSSSSTVSVLRNTSSSGSITTGSFAAKVDFVTGSVPRSVAIGDLDGDGKADLVVANYGSATVSVFRNTSASGSITSGSFAAKVDFTTGTNPWSVAIGDLDGDGKADLAMANYGSNTVSVLRNTGSSGSISAGSFATKVDFTTGSFPFSVAIGDLDGDSKADLAVANLGADNLSILRNISSSGSISSGSFAAKVNFTTGASPTTVVIGDLDGDGKADLVVANNNSNNVSVIRNNPLFVPPAISTVSPLVGYPSSSVTITGTNFNTTPTNNIVYFGATQAAVDAASATSLTVTVPTGATYQPVSVLNTAMSQTGYSQYSFLPTFDNSPYISDTVAMNDRMDFTTVTNPYSVAIGDLDGDGKADLAVANYGSNTVSVFRNTSSSGSITSGSFAAEVDFTTGTHPYSVAMGDLDGDGKVDLAVANYNSNTVSVFHNTSSTGSITSGSFTDKVDFITGTNPRSVAIGDLDGDGKADLVVANYSTGNVSVLRNTSSRGSITPGSFDAMWNYNAGTGPHGVAIGDLDGDGKADLAVVNYSSNTVSLFRNTSTMGSIASGWFAPRVNFSSGQAKSVAIGDLDGDGKADLAVANYNSNTVSVLRNTSISGSITSSSFAARVDFITGTNPGGVVIGDLDGDGKADLAVSNAGSSTVSVLRNTSSSGPITSGSFAAKVDFTTGTDPYSVAIGDLDGDGKADLAVANYTSSTVSVIRNSPLPAPTVWYSKSTGNLNDLATWGANIDGTGTSPTDFTTSGMTYNIVNNLTPTINASWAPVGTVNVGDGIAAVNFTIPSGFAYSGSAINVLANSTLTLSNTTIPALGTLAANSTVVYAGTSPQTVTGAAYSNLVINNAAGVTSAGAATVSDTLKLTAGAYANGSNLSMADNAYIVRTTGSLAAAPTWSSRINVTYNGSGSVTQGPEIPDVAANASVLMKLNILSGTYTLNANIQVNHDLTVNGTLAAGPYNITEGNHVLGTGTETATTGILYMTSPVTYIYLTAIANLSVNNTTIIVASPLTITGKLILDAGDISGSLIKMVNGTTIEVRDAYLDGAPVFAGSINIDYTGNYDVVTGLEIPSAAGVLNNLSISKTGAHTVTLGSDAVVNGTLAFNSGGVLNTGSFVLTTPGTAGAVTGAGATHYVLGTLIKTGNGSSAINFEVGDASGYAPMLLTPDAAITSGSIGVSVTAGAHPNVGTSGLTGGQIAHYWTVTDNSVVGPTTITPKVTYNLGDIPGGDNSTYQMQKYTSSSWLASPLVTTNTSAPYTSSPSSGIALASYGGDYIFGRSATTTWYSKSTGNLNDLATWGANTDGSGTSPTDFATSGQTFNIVNNASPTISATWNPAGTVNVGNGIDAINFTIPSGFAYGGAAINVLAAGTLTIANTTIPSLGTLTAGSTVAYSIGGLGSQTVTSATYSHLVIGAATFATAGGDLTINGALDLNGPLITANHALTLSGDLLIGGGTLTAGSSNITIAGTAAQSIAGFTTTGNVTVTKTGGTVTLAGNVSGSSLSVNGSGGTLNLGSGKTHTFTGNLTLSAGTLNGGSSTLQIAGNVTTGGIFNAGTGTVEYNGSGQTIGGFTYNNLTIGGGGHYLKTAGGAITVNNALTVQSNSILNMSTYRLLGAISTITNQGEIQTACTGTNPIPTGRSWGASGTVTYNGTSGQVVSHGVYGDLRVGGFSAVPYSITTSAGDVGVQGILHLDYSNTIWDLGTNQLFAAGFFNVVSNGTIQTQNMGSTPLPTGMSWGGTVNFNAVGAQTVVSASSYNNLAIGGSGMKTLSASTTANSLAFAGGILNTGSFTMTTPGTSGAVSGAGATSYVNGKLIKTNNGSLPITFEVGDAAGYAPMTLAPASAITAGTLGVKVINGTAPGSGLSNMVGHIWTISSTGLAGGGATITPTVTYNNGDFLGSNSAFVTQKTTDGGTTWLPSPLATTNTSSPAFTSTPTGGIATASIGGGYVFGNAPGCTPPDVTTGWSAPTAAAICRGNASAVTINSTGIGAAGTYTVTYDLSGANSATNVVAMLTMGSATGTFNTVSLANPGSTTVTIKYISNGTCGTNVTSNNTVAITVNASPAVDAGSGVAAVCQGGTTAALGGSFGGSATSAIWDDGSAGGIFTNNDGSTPNTTTYTPSAASSSPVTLTLTTGGGSCGSTSASILLTINPLPSISSVGNNGPVCAGNVLTLNNVASGGTGTIAYSWTGPNSFNDAHINPIISSAMLAAGGTYTLVVADVNGCKDTATTTAVVNAAPVIAAVNNDGPICAGNTLNLESTATGGTGVLSYSWHGPNSFSSTMQNEVIAMATPAATGAYSLTVTDENSCATTSVTTAAVFALPAITSISSTNPVCEGSVLNLFTTVTGGAGSYVYSWAGPNTFASGNEDPLVTATATTAANGIYTLTVTDGKNCSATGSNTVFVNVNPVLPITGATTVAAGMTITLSTGNSSGAWSSLTPSVATVNTITGVVSGVSPGSAVIRYTTAVGCSTTITITVTPGATGTVVCVGQTINLDNGGVPGGTWTSANGSIANVGLTSGVVTGVAAGNVKMYYQLPTGGLMTTTVTVKPLLQTTGLGTICTGKSTTLANASAGPGIWASSDENIALVNTAGAVDGVSAGLATISFTAADGCVATKTITVNPSAQISGITAVCVGKTTNLSNSIGGGTWSSSTGAQATVSATGTVYGVASGAPRINYILATGCQSTVTVTVNPLVAITPTTATVLCQGQSVLLANTVSGGVWSSDNTAIAAVNTSGNVTGAGGGSTVVSYTSPAGCVATKAVTVNPTATITGSMQACVGQLTNLSNSIGGGTWSSSTLAYASVSPAGVVTGVAAGNALIKYNMPGGCNSTATVAVGALSPITITSGAGCQGQTIILANATPGGGLWSSSNTMVATVNTSGAVTGITNGSVSIYFTTPAGCVATKTVSIAPTSPITGILTVCVGQSINVSNGLVGGGWSTSSGSLAQVSASGVVTGVAAGTPKLFYIWPNGCQETATVTVRALSPTTGGTNAMCASSSMTLANATPFGGVWSSSNTSAATVSASGFVKGTGAGVTLISFTTNTDGCVATRTVTVNACRQADTSGVTAVSVQELVNDVRLFPNPNKGVFSLKGSVNASEVEVDIMNMAGQVVYKKTVAIHDEVLDEQITLDGNLANGMYLLNLHTSAGNKVFHFVLGQ